MGVGRRQEGNSNDRKCTQQVLTSRVRQLVLQGRMRTELMENPWTPAPLLMQLPTPRDWRTMRSDDSAQALLRPPACLPVSHCPMAWGQRFPTFRRNDSFRWTKLCHDKKPKSYDRNALQAVARVDVEIDKLRLRVDVEETSLATRLPQVLPPREATVAGDNRGHDGREDGDQRPCQHAHGPRFLPELCRTDLAVACRADQERGAAGAAKAPKANQRGRCGRNSKALHTR